MKTEFEAKKRLVREGLGDGKITQIFMNDNTLEELSGQDILDIMAKVGELYANEISRKLLKEVVDYE